MSDVPAHIALFLPSLDGGGAERMMVQLAIGFASLGLKVDIVLVKAQGVYLSQVPVSVRVVNLHARNTYTSFPKLFSYLRREKPTVILSTLPLTDLIILLARRLACVPSRIVLRCPTTVSLLPRSAAKKALERLLLAWIYPWSDAIIAVSHGVAQDLSSYAGIPLNQIHTIYNPVITFKILEMAKEPVNHPWFGQAAAGNAALPVILGLGRLSQEKNFPTLIRAFAIVRQEMPCRLVILGEGKDRQQLEELAHNLDERGEAAADVFMPGFVENPFAYMNKADVFVLSSVFEGLPGSLIQAMACGCPVVSTDCPHGPAEILKAGEYGYLVPIGDARAMADAIRRVLSGDVRKPPPEWLVQFKAEPVLRQYLNVMGVQYAE
jgi:glycosyltransferase involved in cell wall biosynthesis